MRDYCIITDLYRVSDFSRSTCRYVSSGDYLFFYSQNNKCFFLITKCKLKAKKVHQINVVVVGLNKSYLTCVHIFIKLNEALHNINKLDNMVPLDLC